MLPSWLGAFIDRHLYQLLVQMSIQLLLLLAVLLFCIPMRNSRKRHFFLRLSGMLLLGTVFVFASACLRTHEDTVLSRLGVTVLMYLVPLGVVLFCFEGVMEARLKAWCSGIAASQIAAVAYGFIQQCFFTDTQQTLQLFPMEGTASIVQWLVFFITHLLFDFCVYLLAGRRLPESYNRQSRRTGILICLASLMVLTLTDAISLQYQQDSLPLYLTCRFFTFVTACVILLIYSGLELHNRANEEIRMMDLILSQERKQYQQMKENIEVINRMCHDLRHQMEDFSDRLTADEMDSLQKAMDLYDSNIRTGCEALDVVLYLHHVTCEREHIRMTCLADGAAISFMRTQHIYYLFNNAIGNAIEAVCKIERLDKRVISITVSQKKQVVEIQVTNYFSPDSDVSLRTTKNDRIHHGFGTQSMKYIAEQYHGTLYILAEGDIYTLTVHLPIALNEHQRRKAGFPS